MEYTQQEEIIYSKVNLYKIIEHQALFGIPDHPSDINRMPSNLYRQMVGREAFFFVDHEGRLRHQFTGEYYATSKEQFDIFIDELKKLRDEMSD
ncbi:hypothetical protein [Klebsiella oxytoca]|uniref:Uncharacterized protein n=1 Tax=Klebsiella oxytoca TaxID=571 RepID=A0AAD3UHK6_KLEOX|nr:hypothetical protein [Klebsiella oxytoca]ELT9681863.1 hypothetical protein [Klebsiella oxytoca]ELT9975483.1 hypothetical protein [Klebsiella oxytoca]MBL6085493.1 hypothetical protein [Klebsiella oxytoca]MBL6252120.1 hypothetical protein [Klebsiella oxytoca]MBL6269525.1 hypothetical protein [Klebsiella oxytoca]